MSWLSKRTGIHIKVGGTVGKVANNVGNAAFKAVKDTGHAVGKAATSNVGKVVEGAALATFGAPLAAATAIGAGTQIVGRTIMPHGGIKAARQPKAIIEGAAVGAAGSVTGTVVRKGLGGFRSAFLKPKPATDSGAGFVPKPFSPSSITPLKPVSPGLPAMTLPPAVIAERAITPPPTPKTNLLAAVEKAITTPTDVAAHIKRTDKPVKVHMTPDPGNATDAANMLNVNRDQTSGETLDASSGGGGGGGGGGGAQPQAAAESTGFDWRKWIPWLLLLLALLLVVYASTHNKGSAA